MPLYEYECVSCGIREETLQAHGEIIDPLCPRCQGKMRKIVSAPAIQFKGSGWYVTEYGRGSGRSSTKDDSGEKAGEKKESPESKKEDKSKMKD